MVLDCCITITSTIISIMMNGICCVYQQSEEEKLREAIRQDIRTEYHHAMYHHHHHDSQSHIDPDMNVIIHPTPIPTTTTTTTTISTSTSFVTDHSMDGDESVFIVSSMRSNIQEGVGPAKSSSLHATKSDTTTNHPSLLPCGTSKITASFRHDDTSSPFIQYIKNQNGSRLNALKNKEVNDDDDEEIQRILTSSTSWTTISIV